MKIYSIAFLISIVVLAVSIVVVYEIADYMNPPVTEDGHRYMPTGNVFITMIYSILFAVLSFFISARILRRKNRS
jgi:hypothetical protein